MRGKSGFTLLEVMIALAIMGLSLTAISRSQVNSIRAANRAKLITVATMLARYKMVEVEDKLFEEGFSDFEKAEEGDFKEEGFERFHWTLKVDKVELPAAIDPNALTGAMGASSEGGAETKQEAQQSRMVTMGAQMLSKQFEMIRNVLEQSIRRAQLKVEWKEGSKKREVTVAAYFTDPRKIDAALGGMVLPDAAQPGAAQPGAAQPGAAQPGVLRPLTPGPLVPTPGRLPGR